MRNRKFVKPLLIVVAMILVCVLSVFATLAYLTDTTEVARNTFTVGNVQITLDEADVDEYGKLLYKEDDTTPADRVAANEYKLVPNHKYIKDPTVHVAKGSEESYVRMFVEITDLKDVKAVFDEYVVDGKFLPQYFVDGWDDEKWLTTNTVIESADGTKAYYEFRYFEAVDAREKAVDLVALFTHINVPGDADNDALASLAEMQINVVAQAVQADGFADANAAFKALDGADILDAAGYAAFFVDQTQGA